MRYFLILCALAAALTPAAAQTPSAAGRITGIGGIFFRAKDPAALAQWYQEKLGLPIEAWGGAILKDDVLTGPPYGVWAPFKADTDYFAPSTREFMINFAVDDLDAFIAKLKDKGITPVGRDNSDPNGKFAWIMDPEGTKIELWEPKRPGG